MAGRALGLGGANRFVRSGRAAAVVAARDACRTQIGCHCSQFRPPGRHQRSTRHHQPATPSPTRSANPAAPTQGGRQSKESHSAPSTGPSTTHGRPRGGLTSLRNSTDNSSLVGSPSRLRRKCCCFDRARSPSPW